MTQAQLLNAGVGEIAGDVYLPATQANCQWGFLPNRDAAPVATVASGATVTIDTISHEGILEDQGGDPVAFFGRYGIKPNQVLDDARAVAAALTHDFDDGPHIVVGPIAVGGACPGDVLKIDVLDLALRTNYGVVSNRHGLGCLAGEFPETPPPASDASRDNPDGYRSVFEFVEVEESRRGPQGLLRHPDGRPSARFPLRPFLGIMGVAPDTSDPVPSVPPGPHGGNIDIKLLEVGSTLYLPVQVPGALFYVGDPHFAQGDGEVALTALEAPLRATLRLSVHDAASTITGPLNGPFVETDEFWVPTGLDVDLDEATRAATRAAITFLTSRFGLARAQALAYLSAAADFHISQVVDAVKGVHCCIRKSDFPSFPS